MEAIVPQYGPITHQPSGMYADIVFINDDLPELERPTNKNYFYFLKSVLSYSNWLAKNFGNVL